MKYLSAFKTVKEPCTNCGCDVVVVKNSFCKSCSLDATVDIFNLFNHREAIDGSKYSTIMMGEICRLVANISDHPDDFILSQWLNSDGTIGVIRKMSPRKCAIKRGDKWYTPDDPCRRCNTRSMRYVATGACQGCKGIKASDSAAKACIDALGADFVISRKDAKTMGFKVYRTGFYCKRGHTGWRWTSTGNCIDCAG